MSTTAPGKYLTLSLAGDGYSIPVISVREIIRYQPVTPVPQLPGHIRGVINLRGRIIPVVDLRMQFDLPAEVRDRTCIVVVAIDRARKGAHVMGLIVDSVEDVSTIGPADIEAAPTFGHGIQTEFLSGIAKVNGKVKMLLNIERIVDTTAIIEASVEAPAA